jgi:hypothetical protein
MTFNNHTITMEQHVEQPIKAGMIEAADRSQIKEWTKMFCMAEEEEKDADRSWSSAT